MEHYSLGYNTYTHKGKRVSSIVGNAAADSTISKLSANKSMKPGVVPPGHKDRPDRIANALYNSPKKLWLLCLTSQRYDVFEDFNIGERIVIPR